MATTADRAVLLLVDLETFDPQAPAGGLERRFCCPLPVCSEKPRDASHRSLSLNTSTGAWRCHRCGGSGVLREQWRPRALQQRAAGRRAFAVAPRTSAPAPRQQLHNSTTSSTRESAAWNWRQDLAEARPIVSTQGAVYLKRRGVPVEIAAAAGVLYARSWCGRPAVVFPLRDQAGAR